MYVLSHSYGSVNINTGIPNCIRESLPLFSVNSVATYLQGLCYQRKELYLYATKKTCNTSAASHLFNPCKISYHAQHDVFVLVCVCVFVCMVCVHVCVCAFAVLYSY